MGVKIYINEYDSAKTKLSKINKAVADYGKELYDRCQAFPCSAGAKKYITPYACQNLAYSALTPLLFKIPSEYEIEIPINLNYIRQITQVAEQKYKDTIFQNADGMQYEH